MSALIKCKIGDMQNMKKKFAVSFKFWSLVAMKHILEDIIICSDLFIFYWPEISQPLKLTIQI